MSATAFSGVPTFFWALCHTASQGGTSTYATAGHELARHLRDLCPDDLSVDDWQQERDRLGELLNADDTAGAWTWFRRWLPACAELIPRKRRAAFLAGALEACNSIGLD